MSLTEKINGIRASAPSRLQQRRRLSRRWAPGAPRRAPAAPAPAHLRGPSSMATPRPQSSGLDSRNHQSPLDTSRALANEDARDSKSTPPSRPVPGRAAAVTHPGGCAPHSSSYRRTVNRTVICSKKTLTSLRRCQENESVCREQSMRPSKRDFSESLSCNKNLI